MIISIIFFNILLIVFSNNINNEVIISLSCNNKSIKNVEKVIYSILNQNVDHSLYKIILILSKYDFSDSNLIPNNLISLEKKKRLKIIIIDNYLTSQTRLIYLINFYPNNPILFISNNVILPYGWLDMFINDHKKYPNDAISASIQYFFGKNLEIKEFIEGYKGEKFGTFNNVPDMIFNFALINTDLGGTLYPKNFFKNKTFYDSEMFMTIPNNSNEFWESCFIMIENKNLRQSSKIYDFTKYIINNNNYNINGEKLILLEKIKSSFLKYFPEFKDIVENRQHKIIISFTSHPQRFNLLTILLKSIKEQSLKIKNIFFFLTEEEKKNYTLNISEFNIITVKENLRPHKKYYYAMQLFREYAIITLDDDTFYPPEALESLFNSYLEYPNLISGRRSHYITYRNNGEFKNYYEWEHEQTFTTEPDFNIFLTGNGGIIYPPDILNINEKDLDFIYETITNDDITLKYFSLRKGIPCRWVRNNNINGIKGLMPKISANPLFSINRFNNDIYIKKIKSINQMILKNLCVSFKNLETGLTIYLYNIFNISFLNYKTQFNIYAFSYCQIKNSKAFYIYFDNLRKAYCHFDNSNNPKINKYQIKKLIATCTINSIIDNLNDYYFPKVQSETSGINIKFLNYRKHIRIIFEDFYCIKSNNCFLKALFYKIPVKDCYSVIRINNTIYICKLKEEINFLNYYNFPIERVFNCKISNLKKKITKNSISGLPKKMWILEKRHNKISNIFIISRIVTDKENQKGIIIIGKLINDLKNDLNNVIINFVYPNFTLQCYINSISKEVQSYIYCTNNKEINSEILIENQVAYSKNNNESLLLINEETFIEIDSENYPKFKTNNFKENDLDDINFKNIYFSDYFNIIFFIIFYIIKLYFNFWHRNQRKIKLKK